MSEQLIPLSEVAELLVDMVDNHRKQAEALSADEKPPVPVATSAEEDEDVKLNDTKSEDAVKTMADAVGDTTEEYTSEGAQTEAKDESSAVETDRGSVVAADIRKQAALKIAMALIKSGKVLTTAGRKRIKQKNFAIPSKAKGAKAKAKGGNYPIPDLAHARNALSRVSQFGTPAEQAQVRKKVYAKYPQLKENKKDK